MYERHLVIRQIYVCGAMLAFAATFMPLFVPETSTSTYATMTLWSAIWLDGGGAAAIGVLLVLALVAIALSGAARPAHGFRVPTGVLAVGAIALLMLLLRPGTGSSPPSFGPGAGLLLGTTLFLMATALTDALLTPVTVMSDNPSSAAPTSD